jgi:hypothetical protein
MLLNAARFASRNKHESVRLSFTFRMVIVVVMLSEGSFVFAAKGLSWTHETLLKERRRCTRLGLLLLHCQHSTSMGSNEIFEGCTPFGVPLLDLVMITAGDGRLSVTKIKLHSISNY